jgi:transcriptional regulator with XRE-family HTH domain
MNEIGDKIRLLREQRGLSQENLVQELGLTQPSYARLEKDDDRINITRLINIANILKTTVSTLINENAGKVINQQGSENPHAYVDSIINADKEHITSLKEEIAYLRALLKK